MPPPACTRRVTSETLGAAKNPFAVDRSASGSGTPVLPMRSHRPAVTICGSRGTPRIALPRSETRAIVAPAGPSPRWLRAESAPPPGETRDFSENNMNTQTDRQTGLQRGTPTRPRLIWCAGLGPRTKPTIPPAKPTQTPPLWAPGPEARSRYQCLCRADQCYGFHRPRRRRTGALLELCISGTTARTIRSYTVNTASYYYSGTDWAP